MSQMNVKRINRLLSTLYFKMRTMEDDGRDLPVRWNVMHMYTSQQLAKLIALKRGMDMETAALAAALHDITVIVTGRTERHAELAEPYLREIIHEFNTNSKPDFPKISAEEADFIINAVIQHSDKGNYTEEPFTELLKDVDSIDRFLLGIKSEGAYLERSLRVLKELGIE